MKNFFLLQSIFRITFISYFCLIFNALNVFSQQVSTEDQKVEKHIILDEVVISANRVEEPLKKVSQQIQSIPARKIQEIAAPTSAEILTSVLGLTAQKSQQGGGSPNLRGFEANRILLVVDGVRMNNLIFRAGHLQNIISVDPAILERIEILFGPSSTMFGSDALGGTIHLITRDPELAANETNAIFKLNAYSRYSSANSGLASHLDVNIATKKLGSFTSISSNTFGDLRMGKSKNPFYSTLWSERPYYMERFGTVDSMVKNPDPLIQKYSAYQQTDLMQKFIFKPGNAVSHRLNLQFSTTTDIPRYDRLTETTAHGLKYAQWYYGPQIRFLSAYDVNMKNKLGFNNIHLGLSAQYIEESRNSRKTGADYLTRRHEFVTVAGGNLDLNKTWTHHHLNLGSEFQLNSLKSTASNISTIGGENIMVDSRYPDGENKMNFIDFYISHCHDISNKLSINQAIRGGYTSLHSAFVNEAIFPFPFRKMTQNTPTWSASLGLVYFPFISWKTSINFSSGYRVPNIDDLSKIFERTQNTLIVPNPNIKPEQSYNCDLGATKCWDNGLKWESNVFFTLLNNIIVVSPFNYMGKDSIAFDGSLCQVLSSQNKNSAYLYGFSSSVNGKISSSFAVDAGLYYTYGRIHEDDGVKPMNSIAPISGKIGTTFKHKSFSTSFFVLFNGWKTINNYYLNGEDNELYATPKGMPAWFTLNLRVDYKISKLLAFQLGIDNILDTQYRLFASGINAPGRNILATLRFSL